MNHNQIIGRFGEDMAEKYLVKNGYKIIGRNIKTSYKEIDIVALKNNCLSFVEVKTRTSDRFGLAEEAVSAGKLNSLKKAVGKYLTAMGNKIRYADVSLDLVAIDLDKEKKTASIKHYQGIA
jgi:putative endonuclease